MAEYKPEIEYTEAGWRRKTDTTRHHRERNWDYCGRGIYHFTFVVANRYHLFGEVVAPVPQEARMELNDFGRQVWNILRGVPRFYRLKGYALKTLAAQIMPDHIHWVLQVVEPLPQSIGTVVRGFKAACTKAYKEMNASGGENAAKVGDGSCCENAAKVQNRRGNEARVEKGRCCENAAMVEKGSCCENAAKVQKSDGSIWQAEKAYYHERILHSAGELQGMIDYVKDNPRRLALKRANPQLFKLHQRVQVAGFECTTLGNQFLLDYPMKAVMQCSRRLTQAEIDKKKEECIAEAERGIVFASAGISEGEKQICRALREAGFPLIILLKDGFPKETDQHYKYFKPCGVYFEACAAGQLLLIEPSQVFYDDQAIERAVSGKAGTLPHDTLRYRFLALNTLAQMIVSEYKQVWKS